MLRRCMVGALLPLLLIFTLLRAPTVAAEDALQHVPQDALGFAVINELKQTSDKLEGLFKNLQIPLPSPLAFFRASTGAQNGLDEQGQALVVLMPGREGQEAQPVPVVFVPVTDYDQFIAQFEGNRSGEVAEVQVAGEQVLVAKKGDFAVVSNPDNRETLQRLRTSEANAPEEVETLREWLTRQDAAGVLLPQGIDRLVEQALSGLREVKETLSAQGDDVPQELQQAFASFDAMIAALEGINAEVAAGGVALRLDEAGNTHLASRVLAREGGKFAEIAAGAPEASNENFLAALPGGAYVFAGGGAWSPEISEAMMNLSVGFMKANLPMYGLENATEEDFQRLMESSKAAMEGATSMAIMLQPGEEDEALYSNFIGVIKVGNASEFLDQYEESMKVWGELADESTSPLAMKMEMQRVDIQGKQALMFTMDMSGMFQAQEIPQGTELLDKMFGPGGKLTATLVPADDSTVLFAYVGQDRMAEMLTEYDGGEKLGVNAGISTTRELLIDGAHVRGYLSPGGMVSLAQRAMKMFAPEGQAQELPAFPETPPVGFAFKLVSDGLETDMVLPAQLIQKAREYGNQFQPQQEPPQLEQ